MKFRVSKFGEKVVVFVSDKLTVGNSEKLRTQILGECKCNKDVTRVVIDFSNTRFIDSSGLEILTDLSKEMSGLGGDLTLVNIDVKLRSLLELAALDFFFDLQEK